MKIIKIINNPVNAKLIDAGREEKLIVSNLLSYQVSGAEHTDSFKSGTWDGTSSMFNFRTGGFPAGFVPVIKRHFHKLGYKVIWKEVEAPPPLGDKNKKYTDVPDDPAYSYQGDSIEKLLKMKRMIAQVATGGGKSRIAALSHDRIKRPTMFLTTRGVLMHQMRKNFTKILKKPCGIIGDGHWEPDPMLNVVMVQSIGPYIKERSISEEIDRKLTMMFKKEATAIVRYRNILKRDNIIGGELNKKIVQFKAQQIKARPTDKQIEIAVTKKVKEHNKRHLQVVELLKSFEFVILEEAHETSGDTYYEIMKLCKNAHYRLALTATPFMKDNQEDNFRLHACTGPIGVIVSEKKLIDLGVLATPYFRYIKSQKPERRVHRHTDWQRAYKYGVVENQWRNKVIVEEASKMKSDGLTMMVLVQQKNHGKILAKLMKAAGIRCKFIYGDHNQTERQEALDALSSGELDCLIGSTILDVGVDVPSIGGMILGGGGKAEVALRQRIGRSLRRKTVGENKALIIDFIDDFNTYLHKHSLQRLEIVKSTPGFAENILE